MIALANDHAGLALKREIVQYFQEKNINYDIYGTESSDPVDYPYYAKKVAEAVLSGKCEKGILICGTGIGMSIAANRFKGIRAALCTDPFMAKETRRHNDSNILVLGGRVIGPGMGLEIVETFLNTEFSGNDRHIRRVNQLDEI